MPILSVVAVRCFFLFVVFARYINNDVADDVRDGDVTENPWSPAGRGAICPRCPTQEVLHRLPQADVIRLHVERIKRELLRKLGLAAPPNVTGRRLPSVYSLPRPLLSTGAGNPGNDVTEDGVFPDDDVDYSTAMSDDVASSSQQQNDYYHDDDSDSEDDDDYDNDDDGDDFDYDELGPPAPPPRSKQIIVFGQQCTSTPSMINHVKATNLTINGRCKFLAVKNFCTVIFSPSLIAIKFCAIRFWEFCDCPNALCLCSREGTVTVSVPSYCQYHAAVRVTI